MLDARSTLTIAGRDGRRIRAHRYRARDANPRAALVLPGYGYNADMPLLYHCSRALFDRGFDVLAPRFDYDRVPAFLELSEHERWSFGGEEARAALDCVGDVATLVVVAKSLGTRQAAALLEEHAVPDDTRIVWLTPTLHSERLRRAACAWGGPSLWIAGTGDRHFLASAWDEVLAGTDANDLLVEDANHAMEVPEGTAASLGVLQRVVRAVEEFVEDRSLSG